MPPHGFYWFMLSEAADAPQWSTATPGPMAAEHRTLVLRGTLAEALEGHNREILEREILPQYIGNGVGFRAKTQISQA